MNKDIEVNLLSLDTQAKSNKKLSTNAKVFLAFATGAIVSFMAVSYNQQPSQQLTAQTTNLANSQQIEDNGSGYSSPFYIQWDNTYAYNDTIDYLNEEFFQYKSYGFANSTIRYCVVETSEYYSDWSTVWEEINSTLTQFWDAMSSYTCIKAEQVALEDDCQLVYYIIENEILTSATIQPRNAYSNDLLNSDKIYIFYPWDYNEDEIRQLTFKALGLEYENLRNDYQRYSDLDQDLDTNGVMFGKYDSDSSSGESNYFADEDYMLNLLYCPSLAFEGMAAPLNYSTHIYAVDHDKFMYFGKKFIGVKVQANQWHAYPAYAWFAAPWYEYIVDVFPSKNDSSKIYVHTKTTLYTVDKYSISPELVWMNLPSPNVTIVELTNGQIILIQAENSTGYVRFYHQSNLDFNYETYQRELYDWDMPTKVQAVAIENSIYFIHRGYLYTYTPTDYGYADVALLSSNYIFNDAAHIVPNTGEEDNYIVIVDSYGNVYNYNIGFDSYSQPQYTMYGWVQEYCGSSYLSGKHYSRIRDKLYYLSSENGAICKADPYLNEITIAIL